MWVGELAALPKSMAPTNNSVSAWSKKILMCYKKIRNTAGPWEQKISDQHVVRVWGIKPSLSCCPSLCLKCHSPEFPRLFTAQLQCHLLQEISDYFWTANHFTPSLGSRTALWCSCLPCFMPLLECLPLLPHLLYLHSPHHLARPTSAWLMLDDYLLNERLDLFLGFAHQGFEELN